MDVQRRKESHSNGGQLEEEEEGVLEGMGGGGREAEV